MQGVPSLDKSFDPIEDHTKVIRSIRGVISIRESEIVFVKSAGNYVEICIGDRTHVARGTLANFSKSLQSDSFVQIHRSYLLNTKHVAEVKECGAGLAEIRVNNGKVLPVSRKRRRQVLNGMSLKTKAPHLADHSVDVVSQNPVSLS